MRERERILPSIAEANRLEWDGKSIWLKKEQLQQQQQQSRQQQQTSLFLRIYLEYKVDLSLNLLFFFF